MHLPFHREDLGRWLTTLQACSDRISATAYHDTISSAPKSDDGAVRCEARREAPARAPRPQLCPWATGWPGPGGQFTAEICPGTVPPVQAGGVQVPRVGS